MRLVGGALIAIGVLVLLYALKMGALEIPPGGPEAGGTVIGNDYYPHLVAACLIAVTGVVLSVLAQQRRYDDDNLDRLVELSLNGPRARDLSDPAYRGWLLRRYHIKQHPGAGGFLLHGKSYPTLDDAVLAAHALDIGGDC